MRIYLTSLLFLSCFGCAKKEIKLPVLAEAGIHDIQNHSQVWFFFQIKNKDTLTTINKKNTISSTHWIFNIDKRLPLKTIIQSVIELQDKHANSVHSKEGMHNYFSYADTLTQRLSLLEFDDVHFETDSLISKQYLQKNNDLYTAFKNINLLFTKNHICVDAEKTVPIDFKSTLAELVEISSDDLPILLHLNFDQNLLYKDYLYYKTIIHSLSKATVKTNTTEFIFNKEEVPDCDCE